MRTPLSRSLLFAPLLLAALAPAGTAFGQSAPLARYVPKDDLIALIEFDGLDAHAEAWKDSACASRSSGEESGYGGFAATR